MPCAFRELMIACSFSVSDRHSSFSGATIKSIQSPALY